LVGATFAIGRAVPTEEVRRVVRVGIKAIRANEFAVVVDEVISWLTFCAERKGIARYALWRT